MADDLYADFRNEDISSLVRIEKSSGQLSSVRKDLYPAMRAVHERISKECQNADEDSMDYELAVDKKRKLVSNIKLVVEMRMGKVASMALRGAMGVDLNSTVDQLPPEEKQFYEEVLESAKKLWSAPHKKKVVHIPELVPEETPAPVPAPEVPQTEAPAEEPVPVQTEVPQPEPVPVAEVHVVDAVSEEQPQESDSDDNPAADCFDLVTVRMLETMEPFAGTERSYSLKKEDIVSLPKSLASILVGRKLAVILRT
jgi:DNA replication initiation complex subunit (GINS family)